jgi:CheY-like chemotaxis protein
VTVLSEPSRVKEQVVVCLEDDRDLARLIQVTLRPWTRAFYTAYDGIHGLDLIRQERPDLVLLDLNLPGLNGVEVFDRLQADPELCHIPVIVLSANQRETSASRARYPLERVAAYLTKPFSLGELRELLRPYLAF